MGHWKTHYTKGQAPLETGQAILEVAVFGALMIMLMGILLNYGLRYNFQQRINQEAFRKALASAAVSTQEGQPTSVSYVLVDDKHIANHSDPWAFGSVLPVTSSASVVRDYKMQETANTEAALPELRIEIKNAYDSDGNPIKRPIVFKTAGFRQERHVPYDSIEKYQEIYGDGVQACQDVVGAAEECSEDMWLPREKLTIQDHAERDEDGNIALIRFIDPCAGQIVDYDTAVKQCRRIVDIEVCEQECEKGKSPDDTETDCEEICGQTMNPPNQENWAYSDDIGGAWYCQQYTREENPAGSLYRYTYTFPHLDGLFTLVKAKEKKMGLQTDYTQRSTVDNQVVKSEDRAAITTTDTVNWQVDTTRTVIYKPSYGSTSSEQEPVVSKVSNNKSRTWSTNW